MFTPQQLDRYSRHFVLREIGVSGQKKLLASKVLVIGAGALSSASLMYLAAAGVGTIGVADYDRVERSNLQRQIIHRTENIGKLKTDSALLTMKEINPDISVNLLPIQVNADNIEELTQPYDFIIDGIDRFETKFLINDVCVLLRKPYSHAGAVRFGGQTMTYIPNSGPCLRCLLGNVPPHDQNISCSESGVLGAVTGIIGSIQAAEAVKYLLGIGELLSGRILTLDALSMDIRIAKIEKSNPHCRVCGEAPDISSVTGNREEYEINRCSVRDGERK